MPSDVSQFHTLLNVQTVLRTVLRTVPKNSSGNRCQHIPGATDKWFKERFETLRNVALAPSLWHSDDSCRVNFETTVFISKAVRSTNSFLNSSLSSVDELFAVNAVEQSRTL